MIKLKETFQLAKEKGIFARKQELADLLWDKSSKKSAYMNLKNLIDGKSKKIDVDSVVVICETCGVSADYLFGLTNKPNNDDAKKEIVARATEIAEKAKELVESTQF